MPVCTLSPRGECGSYLRTLPPFRHDVKRVTHVAFFFQTGLLKVADATVGALLCRVLARCPSPVHAGPPPDLPPADCIRRVLVIRPGGMGDMLVLLPMLALLRRRFPAATLDVICETRNLAVLALAGNGGGILPYDAHPLRLLRLLRSTRYDVVLDSEQFHNFSAIFAVLTRAPIRIGFKINPLRNPLYTHLVGYDPDGNEGAQFLRLLGPLGISPEAEPLAGLLAQACGSVPADVDRGLAALSPAGAFVALHPGAGSRHKQWAPDRFGELALRLHREYGLAIVLVGDRRDARQGDRILGVCRQHSVPAMSCQGILSLAETAAVIRRARLFVGTDSGLGHLAVASGRPTVVLFGPSDAAKWGVNDATHATVRARLGCAPCFIFGYHKPCEHVACMQQISVDAVYDACRRVMRDKPVAMAEAT